MDIAYECIFTLIVSSDGPGRQGIFFRDKRCIRLEMYSIRDQRMGILIINKMKHDFTVSELLHYFSLDGHSQLRTMADGLHGSFTHAMYTIRDERLAMSEWVFLLSTDLTR